MHDGKIFGFGVFRVQVMKRFWQTGVPMEVPFGSSWLQWEGF